jgi:hypothetical protein
LFGTERRLVDVTKTERVESELDSFIEGRDRERCKTDGERPAEALYVESTRQHHERKRRQELWEKLRHHDRMIRAHTATFEAIIGGYRLEVAWCEELLGIGPEQEEVA